MSSGPIRYWESVDEDGLRAVDDGRGTAGGIAPELACAEASFFEGSVPDGLTAFGGDGAGMGRASGFDFCKGTVPEVMSDDESVLWLIVWLDCETSISGDLEGFA